MLCSSLNDSNFDTRLNEPWSGLDGIMYGPRSTAGDTGAVVLEIEVRQDLIINADYRRRIACDLIKGLRRLLRSL